MPFPMSTIFLTAYPFFASLISHARSLLGRHHQAYLHSRNDPKRSFKELGALADSPATTGQTFGDTDAARNSAESLRLGLLLRQNANQCLAYAVQTPDGSWSNAALAASISITLIDVSILLRLSFCLSSFWIRFSSLVLCARLPTICFGVFPDHRRSR